MKNMRSVSDRHYTTDLGVSGTGLGVGVERLGLAISSPAGKNNESSSRLLHLDQRVSVASCRKYVPEICVYLHDKFLFI